MTNRRAIFPGSFDPITLGHVDIVERAIDLFDEIIIAVGTNADKRYRFDENQRMLFIRETFKAYPSIKVMSYNGLTIDFCKKVEADYILRGLRNPADFEFEKAIACAAIERPGARTRSRCASLVATGAPCQSIGSKFLHGARTTTAGAPGDRCARGPHQVIYALRGAVRS